MNDDDLWGPECRLVHQLSILRDATRGRYVRPAGLTKLWRHIDELQRTRPASDLAKMSKNRIEQVLKGSGAPPSSAEVRTVVAALAHFSDSPVRPEALSEVEALWRSTHDEVPEARHTAYHFAKRLSDWADGNSDALLRSVERRDTAASRFRDTLARRLDMEATDRSKRLDGVVAISSVALPPPLAYSRVLGADVISRLTMLHEHKILRPQGMVVSFVTDQLETGIRMWSDLRPSGVGGAPQAFLAMEVNAAGSVAMYFRWVGEEESESNRSHRLMGWGLVGAIRTCLHGHAIVNGSGPASAMISTSLNPFNSGKPKPQRWDYQPEGPTFGYAIPTFELPEADPRSRNNAGNFGRIDGATIEHFGPILRHLTGVEDVEKYMRVTQAYFLFRSGADPEKLFG